MISVQSLWYMFSSKHQAVEEFSEGLTRYTEDSVRYMAIDPKNQHSKTVFSQVSSSFTAF